MIYLYIKHFSNSSSHQEEHAEGIRLLSHALQEVAGISKDSEQLEKELVKGPHGKPYLPESDFNFNISNTPGLLVCGICRNEIGVDTELIRPVNRNLLNRTLTKEELSTFDNTEENAYNSLFFRYWTLKEARLKLSGQGILRDMREFSFMLPESDKEQILCSDENVYCHQFSFEEKYYISVCTEKPDELTIRII